MLRSRFRGNLGDRMSRFSSSLALDLRMAEEDIAGSIAHATMLGECGVIAEDDARALVRGLEDIRNELVSGNWTPSAEHEDIHMAVEARLVERLGDVGKTLHTARSRNDQVATDVRLWLKRHLDILDDAVTGLIAALLDRIETNGKILLPGYTHLQRGQPVLLGHHLLGHVWPLVRDRERLHGSRTRVDRSPLGACAMAGTPHPIDRGRTAELLGFADVVDNAMDAVAARDHVHEAVACMAILMSHLSRQAEELVLWSSGEFRFVRLPDEYATGSSIMPQKKNPDAAELVRGKAATVHGDLQSVLGLTRALPLAYNRDLQEERAPLFHAVDTAIDCVEVMRGIWGGVTFDAERFESDLRHDFSLATELADLLVARGVPFRDAHEIVGRIVAWCEDHGTDLSALTPEAAAKFHPELSGDLSVRLDPRAAVERRTSRGGTAWPEVAKQVRLLRERLEDLSAGR